MMKLKMAIILFLWAAVGYSSPNHWLLKGKVVTHETNYPIYGANVYVAGTDLNLKTSETGNFNLFLNANDRSIIHLLVSYYHYESCLISFHENQFPAHRFTVQLQHYLREPELGQQSPLLIYGVTFDSQDHPLSGVEVIAVNTSGYTVSDENGKFALNIPPTRSLTVLTLGFIKSGYQTQLHALKKITRHNESGKALRIRLKSVAEKSVTIHNILRNPSQQNVPGAVIKVNDRLVDTTGFLGSVSVGFAENAEQAVKISYSYIKKLPEKTMGASGDSLLCLNPSNQLVEFVLEPQVVPPDSQPLHLAQFFEKIELATQGKGILTTPNQAESVLLLGKEVQFSNVELDSYQAIVETCYPHYISNSGRPDIILPEIIIEADTVRPHAAFEMVLPDSFDSPDRTRERQFIQHKMKRLIKATIHYVSKRLKQNPSLNPGSLTVRFTINYLGKVINTEIIHSSIEDTAIKDFILNGLHTLDFEVSDPMIGNRTYRQTFQIPIDETKRRWLKIRNE